MNEVNEIQEIEKMDLQLKIVIENNKYLENFDETIKNN